jgi:hypothetical protein
VITAPSRAAASTRIYEIDGGQHARGRVKRTVFEDGSERLRGETEVKHASVRARVIEEVEIDPAGRLVFADITIAGTERGDEAKKNVVIEPRKGLVTIASPEGMTFWSAPTDEPWAYTPVTTDGSPSLPIATPVCAWVTLRATQASQTPRIVDGAARWTHLGVVDQLVVPDGNERFIVLGDDAFQANDDFVMSMQLNTLDKSIQGASPIALVSAPPMRVRR